MKKEEILAECIEQVRKGESTIDECVARYPGLGKELRTLLAISSQLKPDKVMPSTEFVQRTEAQIFEGTKPVSRKTPFGFWFQPRPVLARVLVSVFAGLVVLGIAGGSTAYAAQHSLPGDTLYPVKTYLENLQLTLTINSTARANLHMKLAARRIEELTRQVDLNRNVDIQVVERIKHQLDSAIKELGRSDDNTENIEILSRLSAVTLEQQLDLNQTLAQSPQYAEELQQAVDEIRRGNTIANVAYANQDFLKELPSVADRQLDIGEFKIEGILSRIGERTWKVGNTRIENVYLVGSPPANGSRVKIEGLVKNNKTFLSRIEITGNLPEPTIVEGQFAGTDINGMANVGGISVNIDTASNSWLNPGDNVHLQSTDDNEMMNVTAAEKMIYGNGRNISLKGILKIVQANQKTITIESAGNRNVIDVSQAIIEIQLKNGRILSLSDMGRLTGCDIKLEGLYKKNGVIFARRVRISE